MAYLQATKAFVKKLAEQGVLKAPKASCKLRRYLCLIY